eukprot:COSAG06_NODE_63564_length_262_cov_0.613497_1_plen_46_part_10
MCRIRLSFKIAQVILALETPCIGIAARHYEFIMEFYYIASEQASYE